MWKCLLISLLIVAGNAFSAPTNLEILLRDEVRTIIGLKNKKERIQKAKFLNQKANEYKKSKIDIKEMVAVNDFLTTHEIIFSNDIFDKEVCYSKKLKIKNAFKLSENEKDYPGLIQTSLILLETLCRLK